MESRNYRPKLIKFVFNEEKSSHVETQYVHCLGMKILKGKDEKGKLKFENFLQIMMQIKKFKFNH